MDIWALLRCCIGFRPISLGTMFAATFDFSFVSAAPVNRLNMLTNIPLDFSNLYPFLLGYRKTFRSISSPTSHTPKDFRLSWCSLTVFQRGCILGPFPPITQHLGSQLYFLMLSANYMAFLGSLYLTGILSSSAPSRGNCSS